MSVRKRRSDRQCLPPTDAEEERCLKLVVPRTVRGRVHLARVKNVAELAVAFTILSVESEDGQVPPLSGFPAAIRGQFRQLSTADERPPVGRIGLFAAKDALTLSVLDIAGRRLYLSVTGPAGDQTVTTNVPEFADPDIPDVIL